MVKFNLNFYCSTLSVAVSSFFLSAVVTIFLFYGCEKKVAGFAGIEIFAVKLLKHHTKFFSPRAPLQQENKKKTSKQQQVSHLRSMRKIFKYSAWWFTLLSWGHSTWRASWIFELQKKKKLQKFFLLTSLKQIICSDF